MKLKLLFVTFIELEPTMRHHQQPRPVNTIYTNEENYLKEENVN